MLPNVSQIISRNSVLCFLILQRLALPAPSPEDKFYCLCKLILCRNESFFCENHFQPSQQIRKALQP
uniref:Uncharacterized protein n=1 Tax=Anguilla anguilla TaxID=7936 RepID=A0A0E9P662_ANGAN